MRHDARQVHSRWMIRAMEWNDAKARYPNLWHEGMPRSLVVFDRVANRVRLGDLLAVYYPTSQRHAERAERYLGLSRVVGLRRGDESGFSWIDLQTAHRFGKPLENAPPPRRVFLCCDPGWPEPDVARFQSVFDAAVAEGFEPEPEDLPPEAQPEAKPDTPNAKRPGSDRAPIEKDSLPTAVEPSRPQATRSFGGVAYGGDMRDPRDGTWLAFLGLVEQRLVVTGLRATGRHGLESYLRDPDKSLMNVEAIGLDFPFSVPVPFAESLLGGAFPDEGWWALVKHFEGLSRPDFLSAAQEFSREAGLLKRFTDEQVGSPSPLTRDARDRCPMAFHGMRMIGEDRSRYAVRPFESARARLLLEVHPEGMVAKLGASLNLDAGRNARRAVVEALGNLGDLPVRIDNPFLDRCLEQPAALAAVVAARCCAMAVISGEAELAPEQLAAERAEQVRREGWIYGLGSGESSPTA